MENKKKHVRSNKLQIDYLCQHMAQHPEFAAGEFSGPLGAVIMERKWAALKAALDELGPNRTIDQWRTAWRDQKRKARVEGGALNRAQITTGNAAEVPELSANSSLILGTIGMGMAVGVGPQESPIGFVSQAAADPPSSTSAAPSDAIVVGTWVPLVPSQDAGPSTAPIRMVPSNTAGPSTAPIRMVPSNTAGPSTAPIRMVPSNTAGPSTAPIQMVPSNTAGPSTAPTRSRKSRVRKTYPPDRFLQAQEQLNRTMQDILRELRRGNNLREERNNILRRCYRK